MSTSLPYAGTSGFSGTSTSEERQKERDGTGKTGRMQGLVLDAARIAGHYGITVKHLRERFPDEHHGNVSGALSALHMDGRLVRLANVRDRCKIYVLPENALGRATEPYGKPPKTVHLELTDDEALAYARVISAIESADGIGTSMIGVPVTALKGVVSAIERTQ
jgi:hypothetical protein